MKKPLFLAGMLALTPACAHANAGLVRAPVGQVSVTNGAYAAVGAAGVSMGYPAAAAGASYLTLGSRALTLDAVVTAVNAYTAMALANVRATFNTTVSAEFFNPATRPDVMAAVANLTVPVRPRVVPESMRGPAPRTSQPEAEVPAVEEISEPTAGAQRGQADTVRAQLTNLGGDIKKLNVGQIPSNLSDAADTMRGAFDGFEGSQPSPS